MRHDFSTQGPVRTFLVYLAGPISGLNYEGATDWRNEASSRLYRMSGGIIHALSPMRHKDYLKKAVGDIGNEQVPVHPALPVEWRDGPGANNFGWFDANGREVRSSTGMTPDGGWEFVKPVADETKRAAVIGDSYEQHLLSSQRGIFYRDKFDCSRADLVLVNLLGATKVSIGTVMEIAWADAKGIPLVVAMEKDGNVHNHSMLREASKFLTPDWDEAVEAVYKILCPDLPFKNAKAFDVV